MPCHAMPRTISSRGDDAASPVPDAMMLSQSINWIGRCMCRSLDRDGSSPYERLCRLAAGDAGIPGSRAPTRCLTDCEGTGRRTAQVLALCTRVLTCGERTRHCLAPLLAFPFLNHAKSLRNDPWLMVLGFWTAWSFATLHFHCVSVPLRLRPFVSVLQFI
ncbi:hypothetical protein ZEAMMB73_Zm00001d013592 [Zea mays]|uniref:Uncharacterized protein n=1 Tax=Zea mays TaxID=4577 RepID=A0A1D6GKQ7_MAIZE|nr:hypothetical protein ZEAMMB73_Zm00001d013592 [Zea mays]